MLSVLRETNPVIIKVRENQWNPKQTELARSLDTWILEYSLSDFFLYSWKYTQKRVLGIYRWEKSKKDVFLEAFPIQCLPPSMRSIKIRVSFKPVMAYKTSGEWITSPVDAGLWEESYTPAPPLPPPRRHARFLLRLLPSKMPLRARNIRLLYIYPLEKSDTPREQSNRKYCWKF